MSAVRRIDTITLRRDDIRRSAEGFLEVPALLARTGMQDYIREDGSVSREFRPDGEVFAERSLASRRGKPIVYLHPPSNLTPGTVRLYAMGAVGTDVRKHDDGIHVAGTVFVWDAEAIEVVDSGIIEMSSGFTIDPGPAGVAPNGERYDVLHTNILVNHEAIVPKGRAGTARLLTDSAAPLTTDFAPLIAERRRPSSPVVVDLGSWVRRDSADLARTRPTTPNTDTNTMKIPIKIDGKDVDIEVADTAKPEEIAAAVAKAHEDAAATKRKADEATLVEVEINGAKRRVSKDAADALAKTATPAPADPSKMDRAEVDKLVALARAESKADAVEIADTLASARLVCGPDYKASADVTAMRRDVVTAKLGKAKVEQIDAMPEADRRGALAMAYSDAMKQHAKDAAAGPEVLAFIHKARGSAGDETKKDAAAERKAKAEADAAVPASMRAKGQVK